MNTDKLGFYKFAKNGHWGSATVPVARSGVSPEEDEFAKYAERTVETPALFFVFLFPSHSRISTTDEWINTDL
jgi:hypothetical protein